MAARKIRARTLFGANISGGLLLEAEAALSGIPGAVEKAGAAAVNKTLARMKTRTAKGLSQYLTVRQQNLKRRLYIAKASKSSLEGSLKIMGRPIGIINFKHFEERKKNEWGRTTSGKGVVAQVTQGGKVFRFPTSFIATGQYGNVHVVDRLYPGGKVGTRGGRFPIETVFSQRLYDLFNDSPVPADLKAFIPPELAKQFNSQIDRFLAKSKRR